MKFPPKYIDQSNSRLRQFSVFSSKKQTELHPTPNLPLIDSLVASYLNRGCGANLERVAVIGVQHILETTATLFRGIIQLGVKPGNIFLTGKPYSTSEAVAITIRKMGVRLKPDVGLGEPGSYERVYAKNINKMWTGFLHRIQKNDIQSVIIVDEGGHLIEQAPHFIKFNYPIFAIEQTRGGLYSRASRASLFPLISVAESAAKTFVEPPLVANAIFLRVKTLLPTLNLNEYSVFAVVGSGAIGSAIIHYLTDNKHKVIVYDKDSNAVTASMKNVIRVNTLEEVFANADCVFGCTGQDITQGVDLLDLLKHDQILISCSSGDREFKELLENMMHKGAGFSETPFSPVMGRTKSGNIIKILNGGFPINFDRTAASVPKDDIALTRGLMLAGIIQAAIMADQCKESDFTVRRAYKFCLDPYAQQFVVKYWSQYAEAAKEINPNVLKNFENIDWIIRHSKGSHEANKNIESCFNVNNPYSGPTFASRMGLKI